MSALAWRLRLGKQITVDVDLHPGSGKCEWFLAVFSLNIPVGYTIAY